MENFTTDDESALKDTKLVHILKDFELDDNVPLPVEKKYESESLILLNIKNEIVDNSSLKNQSHLPNWQVSPYDLGGHSPYFSSQKIFSSKTSFFFLVFQR